MLVRSQRGYRRIVFLVLPRGIEPRSKALQASAMTTSAKAAINCLGCLTSTDLVPTLSQRAMLPLHYRHHRINLVEDRGIEPLTQACKARVFPLALIPPIKQQDPYFFNYKLNFKICCKDPKNFGGLKG